MNANWIDTGEVITYRCGHTAPHMVNKYWSRARRAERPPGARDYDCQQCFTDRRETEQVVEACRALVGRFTEEELEAWTADPEGFLRGRGLLDSERAPYSLEFKTMMGLVGQLILAFQREQVAS